MTAKKIGIYGGTFNPIHNGHLAVAKAAKRGLGLNRLILIPAAQPPHKPGKEVAPAKDRLAMARLAVKGIPGLVVSDIEHRRSGPSYTADTVKAFKKDYPNADLYFVIGSDSVPNLRTWNRIGELKQNVTFAVASRAGVPFEADVANNTAGVRLVKIPIEEHGTISSTKIRAAATRKGLKDLPPAVADYIVQHGLYGTKAKSESLYDRVLVNRLLFDSALEDLP